MLEGYETERAEESAEAIERLQRLTERQTAELLGAQALILSGSETIEHTLHHGLVALYGPQLISRPELVGKYERISNELKGKKDEPLLVIRRRHQLDGCTGFSGEGYVTLRTSVFLGIIGDEKLQFDYDQKTCGISVPKGTFSYKGLGNSFVFNDGFLELNTPPSIFEQSIVDDFDTKLPETESGLLNALIPEQDSVTFAIGLSGIKQWLSSAKNSQEIANELLAVRACGRELDIPVLPTSLIKGS